MRTPTTLALLTAAVLLASHPPGRAAAPKFYPDDPIARDPETEDAAAVRRVAMSDTYDFAESSFFGAGDRTEQRALNVNTVDEAPDSSWFTNRLGHDAWPVDRLVRGPDSGPGPLRPWTIVDGKMEGRSPGFTVRDRSAQLFFIKFDPPSNPEMASGAEIISTKFLHAFGYHVPENYVATIGRDELILSETAKIEDDNAQIRPMEPDDIDDLLERAARQPDGRYRALASRGIPGTPVGPFRYHGTRPDDPNDIYLHEHRRELRGLRVFASWLNHDDVRSSNTFDTVIEANGRRTVRHYLLDFGSTLGSGTVQAQTPRAGNEYVWDARPTLITLLTFGFYVRPWIRVEYPDLPSVGRFESTYYRPEIWKPEYPNPAFRNARPDDLFWAARRLAALSEEGVRAVVGTARYTDPRATIYLVDTLLTRRSKILRVWLNGANPIVAPTLARDGALRFDNAALDAAVATEADRYSVQWATFDNATGVVTDVGAEQVVTEQRTQVPAGLTSDREFIVARVRGFHVDYPAWSQPVTLSFRQGAGGWSLVGLER